MTTNPPKNFVLFAAFVVVCISCALGKRVIGGFEFALSAPFTLRKTRGITTMPKPGEVWIAEIHNFLTGCWEYHLQLDAKESRLVTCN